MNSTTIDLTPERWARVDELFAKAVQLPLDRREAYIRDACADDEVLCKYIVELLQIDSGDEGGDLERTVVDALQSAISGAMDHRDDMQGMELGPYRIVRTLGSGGMGIVYLAERADEQYEQRVAIKLGRHRLVDQQAEQRLRGERQILANLDHPNIARLLDGGTANDGTPYIVMEHIDGVRIDTYCDRHRLGVDERLELFQTICSAVHYAHQNLVVHRDIKPSNILVTDDGMPKLLDFGIARLVDSQGTATDGLTREGAIIMTPENAAPEQVLNRSITTATDTYALGALLYSLLTGLPPYSLEDKTPSEMARIICQTTPPLCSERLTHALALARRSAEGGELEEIEGIGRDRGTTSERLSRRLQGDLDVIAATALRKEPERRYRSVNQLSEDLRLHRTSQPIFARADSWGYRAGKFVRRHVAGVATAGLFVVLLAAFGVAMSIQNQRIAAERDIARQVSTFLEEIFESPDPENARGADVTAKEILDAGAARIDRELGDAPEIRAALLATIGRVYMNLGEYDQSAEMLERSLRLRQDIFGNDDPEVAASKVAFATTLTQQAAYERAGSLLADALTIYRSDLGPESPQVAATLFRLAELHLATGDLDVAARYARESASIYSLYEADSAIDLANATNLHGRILQVTGDLDATETLLREAIDIVERNDGPDHPLMAYYLQNLGVLLRSKGDLEGAEETIAQAVEVTRRVLGERHAHLAGSLVIQGMLLHSKGDFFAAESALRDALDIHREALGADHPFVGYDLTSLGMLYHDRGDLTLAEDTLREALRIYAESLGDEHQYVASALTELGAVLVTSDRPDEAVIELERALRIRAKDYPAGHPLLAATNVEYGGALVSLGRYADAEPILLASHEALQGQGSRRTRRARAAVVRLYNEWGKLSLAAQFENP